ncbi:MAG TPA: NAD-dependent epimerase/dehydratase family protein, partial [Candidatus Saccharimonadales bacterium]|nr:NAD-dependent epimerase/dehydratase family protein [Candidatus Saccharimonadales bacterium]
LSTGSEQNIAHLKNQPNFHFIKADITKNLPKTLTAKTYNIVANLASPASPPHYQRLAIETLMVGAQGTLHLLELAHASKARFFQASTSEVYGDPDVHPQPETYRGNVNCYGPRSMYDEAKRFAEALIYSYRAKYHVSTTIARFFNTYGPRMDPDDGRVVSNFITQALKNKPLTVYGDGSQTRSFCYVDDLIAGIAALIDSDQEGPINLGNPSEFTVLELAQIVKKLTNSKSKIVYRSLPVDDPLQRKPVIDIAKSTLHWEPTIDLHQGLMDTIDYFKNQPTASS